MGYKHQPGNEGNELIPDLAEAEPEVSEDGKTYTARSAKESTSGRRSRGR